MAASSNGFAVVDENIEPLLLKRMILEERVVKLKMRLR